MSAAKPGALSLEALLTGIRAGDQRAATEFVQSYEPLLRRVLRVTGVLHRLQSQMDSQDLVQSVFLRIIQAIRDDKVQFTDEGRLEGYLIQVGRHLQVGKLRQQDADKRDWQRTIGGAAALAEVADSSPSPSEIAAEREQVALVEQCLDSDERSILRARANGAEWQDLAARHDTTPDALRKRIDRVRARIRKTLGE